MRLIPIDPRETVVLMDATLTFAMPSSQPTPLGQKMRFLDNLGTASAHNITITGALGGTVTLSTAFAHSMLEFVGNGWMPA